MTNSEDKKRLHSQEASRNSQENSYHEHTDETSSAVHDVLDEDTELLAREQKLKRSIIDTYNNRVYG